MQLELSFEALNRLNTHVHQKIKTNIKYAQGFMSESGQDVFLRSYATERNMKWKEEMKEFVNNNSPVTSENKINNDFYRHKFKYDVVVPKSIFDTIIDYYLYSVEENVIEDVKFVEKYMDHMMMFCQALFYYKDKYISNIKSKRDKTPMYVGLLYSFLGREYRKILYFLQKIGVIHIDDMYVPAYRDYNSASEQKGICKHYGFADKTSDFCIVYQISSRVIINKAYNNDTRISDEIEYSNKPSNIQRSKELNAYFSDNFRMSDSFKDNRHLDYNGFTYYYSRICEQGPRFRNFVIGRDTFGSRFYHPFLNIKSKMRDFIEIDGSIDNTTIDISNSHPYIFSMLFDNNFVEYNRELMTREEVELFKSIAFDPMFSEKVELFKKIVSSGKYYSFLEENIKNQSAKELKKLNMTYFYGPVNKRNVIYRFFDENFDFINMVKHKMIMMGGYKRLCQLLQRIESKIMIDELFMKLKDEGYKLIPLHDAFMCPKKDESSIRQHILNAFRDIGVKYLPNLDKSSDHTDINKIFDKIKFQNGSLFINKSLLFEELNFIIKSVGINNRVFKEDMKEKNKMYIDQKFEDMRHLIDDDVANKYYELRMDLDIEKYDKFDYTELFEKYKETNITKKKWFSRDVAVHVKVNPIEFINYIHGTNYKTRVRERDYIY